MRVVITGACGLLGSRLCQAALEAGHDVTGLALNLRPASPAITLLPVDLCHETAVQEAMTQARPDVVIHAAAMTDVDGCERNPAAAYASNVAASAHVALAARGAHLVYVSTDYVYDGESGPYREADTPNPRGAYAHTKWLGEEVTRLLHPGATIARTAVVHGYPGGARANFSSWLIDSLSQGKKLNIFVDQIVTPTLADNLASMLLELGTRRLTGLFHVADADSLSRVDYARRLAAVFGFDPTLITPVPMASVALPAPRPRNSSLMTEKVASTLETKPLRIDAVLDFLHRAFLRVKGAS